MPEKDRFKTNKIIKLLSRFASEYTSGLIPENKVETVLENPTDYMKHLYSENELNKMRQNLYQEYYPAGYFGTDGIRAASEIMQNLPVSKKSKWMRQFMHNNLVSNKSGSEQLRDSYFAEWLGIPEQNRRFKGLLIDSKYRPTTGRLNPDYKVLTIKDDVISDKAEQIVNSYYAAKQLQDNKFVNGILAPIKGSGDNYVVNPETHTWFGENPKSKKEWITMSTNRDYNTSKLFANGLASFTVGSNIDPQRGQYISVFDKWDINPFDSDKERIMEKIQSLLNIPQNFDATGGIGKPFYIYDRVYLDDYYGVDSKPSDGSYYGGYLMPVIKKAE